MSHDLKLCQYKLAWRDGQEQGILKEAIAWMRAGGCVPRVDASTGEPAWRIEGHYYLECVRCEKSTVVHIDDGEATAWGWRQCPNPPEETTAAEVLAREIQEWTIARWKWNGVMSNRRGVKLAELVELTRLASWEEDDDSADEAPKGFCWFGHAQYTWASARKRSTTIAMLINDMPSNNPPFCTLVLVPDCRIVVDGIHGDPSWDPDDVTPEYRKKYPEGTFAPWKKYRFSGRIAPAGEQKAG